MEKAIKQYSSWTRENLPENLKAEAEAIKGNEEEIYDRFCRDMTFGTSGLRGKMGLGTNRMNRIVVRRATMGVADYLLSKHERAKVVIGYDTRAGSESYAREAAGVLSGRGIDVSLFNEPTPVPVVSFAIRYMKADGGIMITASHNPKEYNGYKVYDHFGNQIDDLKARRIEEYINKRPYFEEFESAAKGTVEECPPHVKEAYLSAVAGQFLPWTDDAEEVSKALRNLNVVYTPLNGAGRDYAMEVFRRLGVGLTVVREQMDRDGDFPTCPKPNPEREETFREALKYAGGDTDVIIATDPDSDRMGVMAKKDGKFCRLTGDHAGILMLEYVCRCHASRVAGKNMQGQKMVYKSFVSSPFAEDIARKYRVYIKNVPTGFKNIALEMELLKAAGREQDFLFGFEESLGYLYGNYTRDKDGILATQMICLIAAWLKTQGKTLYDRLEDLYREFGYAESRATAIEFHAEKDRQKINDIMETLFSGGLKELLGQPLTIDASHCCDDMFRAVLPEGHQIIIRPSGTELKIKMYVFAKGATREQALTNLDSILKELEDFAVSICGFHKNGEKTYE